MARGKCLYCGRTIQAVNQGVLLHSLKVHYQYCADKKATDRLQRAALMRG